MSAVYQLTSKPDVDGGLLVAADSEDHAVALAKYQLTAQGMDLTRWPVNGDPVYARRVDLD